MRQVNEIIVHATATKPDFMEGSPTSAKVAEVKRWHVQGNGWSDIGYHYLIDRDGAVANGRPLDVSGAHTRGHNTGTIGVSLFGGHGSSADDTFSHNFTIAQDKALRDLIKSLRMQFTGITKITGHNQYSNKACPGFRVGPWLADSPVAAPSTEIPGKPSIWAALASIFARMFK